jgi:hypothetical protein
MWLGFWIENLRNKPTANLGMPCLPHLETPAEVAKTTSRQKRQTTVLRFRLQISNE